MNVTQIRLGFVNFKTRWLLRECEEWQMQLALFVFLWLPYYLFVFLRYSILGLIGLLLFREQIVGIVEGQPYSEDSEYIDGFTLGVICSMIFLLPYSIYTDKLSKKRSKKLEEKIDRICVRMAQCRERAGLRNFDKKIKSKQPVKVYQTAK